MQEALVSELQAALQAKQLATAKAVRCAASRLLSVLSSRRRHLVLSAIGRWVRAIALIEADHRTSAGHEASLRQQLRRLGALAEQRGHQLSETRSTVRAAEETAARATAECEVMRRATAAGELRRAGDKARRESVEQAAGNARLAERRQKAERRAVALVHMLQAGIAVRLARALAAWRMHARLFAAHLSVSGATTPSAAGKGGARASGADSSANVHSKCKHHAKFCG